MKNFAGVNDCDNEIEAELKIARLPVTKLPYKMTSEVPTKIVSLFRDFSFHREWYYWSIKGPTPIEMARELYADAEGKKNVRVAGHCGCPGPEDPWIEYYAIDEKRIYSLKDQNEFLTFAESKSETLQRIAKENLDGRYIFSDDREKIAHSIIVPLYHIDSQLGLCLFADMLRKYKLLEDK